MHCFFPLCEEWFWDREVESYGLRGKGVFRGIGCGKLDVVFKWQVHFGFDAFMVQEGV